MAVGLPKCEFVGVDAAGTAIARGRAMAEEIGLKNLTLRHLDLMEMAPDYGQFDYIIAHGVYSWVSDPVRKQVLAICKGSLAPQGVAYVSYNTFPGCHNRLMLREMMQFHNRDIHEPQQKMQQAFNLLKVLAHALEKSEEPYTKFLRDDLERLSKRSLEAMYHDELADVFAPFYFHEFMDQAQQHDLQFLGEAEFFDMVPRGLSPDAVKVLGRLSNEIVLREQYLDFMRGRHFRKTLLCHPDVALNRSVKHDCVRSYYVTSMTNPELPAPNPEPGATEIFRSSANATLTTSDPLARALLWHVVDKNPERILFSRLAAEVEARARQQYGFAPQPDQDIAADISEFVWSMYCAGLLDLHVHVPPYVTGVTDKPLASPLARWQARRTNVIATLHHRTLQLGISVHQGILALLDGTRNRADLQRDVPQLFESGVLDIHDADGKPIKDMNVVRKAVDEELEGFLQTAARTAVLMG
jgi:methyltransferase-like protein